MGGRADVQKTKTQMKMMNEEKMNVVKKEIRKDARDLFTEGMRRSGDTVYFGYRK